MSPINVPSNSSDQIGSLNLKPCKIELGGMHYEVNSPLTKNTFFFFN